MTTTVLSTSLWLKPSSAFKCLGIGDIHRLSADKGEELIEGSSEQKLVVVLLDIAQVWSADNVVHMQQWMVRDRFILVYIDRCVPWTPGTERLLQGTWFNQSSSTGVDEQGRRFHLRQIPCRNDATRLLHQREMQA